ncbi:MAG: hypothetical protein AAFU67_05260 [Bacteroidota bacterium]
MDRTTSDKQTSIGRVSPRALLFLSCCFTLGLVLLGSCSNEQELLFGNWQATAITEEGDSMRLNVEEVGFTFHPNGIYQYRSTLRYREAGRYRYENSYLFARDTTQPNSAERIVAIEYLTVDSLIMRMRQDSLERIMILKKM